MKEVVRINLDNEMDLILAHKRTMKLAELCGLTLSSQTTFATAVSEIARCAIGHGKKSSLVLSISSLRLNQKEITASLFDTIDLVASKSEALSYAKRLMGDLKTSFNDGFYEIRLSHRINFSGTISTAKIELFKDYFKNEPPLSPYDEIRKKNIQLIDLSEKLIESENQYRILTDTLPLMMFSLNAKGEVIYSNKWLKDSIASTAVPITNLPWHTMIHVDDYKNSSVEWAKAQAGKNNFRTQSRLKIKDKYIWHLISIVPVKNEKDYGANWIGFFVDIHAQKQIEETLKDNKELKDTQLQLRQYQYQLEEKISQLNITNHELEQFAYIASHDLQEPLRKIKTFTDVLSKRLALVDKDKEYFDKIISSSNRMSSLIRDVLNYSQLSKSQQFTEVDLDLILKQVLSDFDLLIQEREVTVNSSPLPIINGIPIQMVQLFSNLLTNAIKFTNVNPVINISYKTITGTELPDMELSPVQKYHHIKFQDNGIGFEQQYAKQIFTIFQQLNDKLQYSGTGIGLALVKKIVDNHNGTITATSSENTGATFDVFLPVHT
jgi:PAS domain S-box-containing protein